MTYSDALNEGKKFLEEANVSEADLSAWYLLQHAAQSSKRVEDFSRAYYFTNADKEISDSEYTLYRGYLEQRAEHIPLEYVTHETEFMGYKFYVDENCLIPRQDTEILVEEVLKRKTEGKLCDMCSGSGCVGISLGKLGKYTSVTFCDISSGALSVTGKNACDNGIEAEFIIGDLWENVNSKFDIIVSNPPYIPSEVIDTLMPEVKDNEPMLALDGGADGLDIYKRLIGQGRDYLEEGGLMALEIGYDQSESVSAIMRDSGFKDVETIKDLADLDRVVIGYKGEM